MGSMSRGSLRTTTALRGQRFNPLSSASATTQPSELGAGAASLKHRPSASFGFPQGSSEHLGQRRFSAPPRVARRVLAGLSLGLVLGGTAFTTEAEASGFSVARFGGEHGTPMTTNGTSLYYNPAGFAASQGTRLFVDVTTAWRSASYRHTEASTDYSSQGGLDADLAREANTAEGSVFNVIPSPAIFLSGKLGDLGLALGFFTPFGGSAYWEKNEDFAESPRYQGLYDGGQRWYTIDGSLTTSYVSGGLGYHLKDIGLSFGASANVLISSISTLRARNADGTDNIVREGRTYMDVSSLDWSLGLGVRYATEGDEVVVGASWQSAPNLNGEMRFSGTLTNIYGPEDALTDGSAGDTDFTQSLPNVFRAGIEVKASPQVAVRLFGDYQTWSAMEHHCVVVPDGTCDIRSDGSDANNKGTVNQPRHWKNTFGVRAGLSYWLDAEKAAGGGVSSGNTELFAGVGYASNAIPDAYLEPALMDFNAFTPVVGARFGLADSLNLAVSYTQVIYLSRDNSGKSKLAQQLPPSRGPDAGGEYKQAIGVLNVNAEYQF